MANMVYGIDFILNLFVTHYIEADSFSEAQEKAMALYESDRFWEDKLCQEFTDASWSFVPENMCDPVVFEAGDGPATITADELTEYARKE